jgi:hypothetical protein
MVDAMTTPDTAINTLASFVVENGKAGAERT